MPRAKTPSRRSGPERSAVDGVLLDHLPALVAAGIQGDVQLLLVALRRLLSHLREFAPQLADELDVRVLGGEDTTAALRRASSPSAGPVPHDQDTRSQLLRPVVCTEAKRPALAHAITAVVDGFLREQRASDALVRAGLAPRYTMLLRGPPGVGKTMLARAIAGELGVPLLQVELSALISSYLGRTGQNIREVLDFARRHRVVLLLDEIDAIAKRRDDQTDLGELKRVVSVLLKELEEWPGPSIVVGATNHPDLIDPAVFRRFQVVLSLELPDVDAARGALGLHLGAQLVSGPVLELAASLLAGSSGSSIRDAAMEARRTHLLSGDISMDAALLRTLVGRATTPETRKRLCGLAHKAMPELSYADLGTLLDVSKATIHNYLKGGAGNDKEE